MRSIPGTPYDEEIGTSESDAEINAKIRKHFGLPPLPENPRKGLESHLSSADVNNSIWAIKRQAELVLRARPGEVSIRRMGLKELQVRVRELGEAGVNVQGYSKLNLENLRGFYESKSSEILYRARKRLPQSFFEDIKIYNLSVD